MTDIEPLLDQFVECCQDKLVARMMDLCKRGYVKLLTPLIQRSKDKNPGDKDKYTILHCAAEHGQLKIVQYLVPLLNDKLPKTGPRKYPNRNRNLFILQHFQAFSALKHHVQATSHGDLLYLIVFYVEEAHRISSEKGCRVIDI